MSIWSFYKNLLQSVAGKYLGTNLTGAEQQANAFTAQEAAKVRDWQTEMSNTQYQRGVADMQAAGLNPALMMSGGASPAPSPSGASASSVSPGGSDMLPALFNYSLGKYRIQTDKELRDRELDIRAYEAETARLTAESNVKRNIAYIQNLAEVTRGLNISNDIAEGTKQIKILQAQASLDLTEAQTRQVDQAIEESSWRIGLIIQQTTSEQMKAALYHTDARLKQLDIKDKTIYLLYADKLYNAKAKDAYYEAEDSALQFAYDKKLLSDEAAKAALDKLKAEGKISKAVQYREELITDCVKYRKVPEKYKGQIRQSEWDSIRKDMLDPVYIQGTNMWNEKQSAITQ